MTSPAPDVLAPDFRETPYWWDAAPRPRLPDVPLPARADVVVVGSGVTGLNAARELARGGRRVAVLDAEDAGFGASTRNTGFVGRVLKRSFSELMHRRGLATAIAYYRELREAFATVGRVIEAERIQCDFRMCGRIVAARSHRQLDALVAEYELKRRHLGDPYEVLDRDRLVAEFNGSEAFVGGVHLPDLAAFHPGKYHAGLLESALGSGAEIHPRTRVEAIAPPGADGRVEVVTSRGRVSAGDVVVATNGYTGAALPWLRRRLIPFRGFVMATEELGENLVAALLPNRRTYTDADFNVTAIQVAPDAPRLLMTALTGTEERTVEAKAGKLREHLVGVFPQLSDVRVSRLWSGWCAAPIDRLPKLVRHQGVLYATGYSFMGMPMGTYLGHKAAWQVMGRAEGRTVFSERGFPTLPFYTGNPWFVPIVMGLADLRARWTAR